ncbi:hypothetical protein JD844_022701 [Phrynosoma platyrhinos]|uniref:C-type lectin domain-containing protein n=1 Tax=Phrynosoma platyrhinos TaxID=52577 RepID=A0ABQ7SWF4_PHRPL|nr:hypothetical protein JD844_022701 [Phrynosoma platyrhinos]
MWDPGFVSIYWYFPSSENGCQNTWELDVKSGSCYQLNTQTALSWKEAYVSCQRQGGDLLSISSASELSYIQAKDDIAEIFWIGLNQLDISGGWQWSDHTPLNFLSWSPEMQDTPLLDGTGCVAMSADRGHWKSYPCETALPYVCKKKFNNTKEKFPGVQSYLETECESDWNPHNGFCYTLMNNSASWKDAYHFCNASNSNLISIHSLADVELVVTKLHIETKDQVWTGFINEDTPALFKWSDGSEVLSRWSVLSCEEKLKYVCMKKGKVLDVPISNKDCPSSEEWKKHGDFCYKIDKSEVSFGKLCNLTITNRFEQEFINTLIRRHSRVEEKYFWTGLQDIKSSGEYSWGSVGGNYEKLTYTNWGSFQPVNFLFCFHIKFFHKERVLRTRTWEEAERFCEALGGHLPSFSHLDEMKEFHTILRETISNDRWVWVGLNKRDPGSLESWQWSDNNPVSTVVMPAEFREDEYDTRDCAALKTLRSIRRAYFSYFLEDRDEDFYLKPFHCGSKLEWVCQITKGHTPNIPEWYKPDSIISCSAKLPFICEKYNTSLLEAHDPSYKPPQRRCPEKWLSFLEKCFRIVPSQDLKFQKANEHCSSFGGVLPSIRSQAEQDFVTSLLPGRPQNIWIGLHIRVHMREEKWVDGSALEYTNFHPLLQGRLRKVQLDLFDEEVNNQCGVLLNNPNSPYVGTWNFTSCADIHSVAICQREPEAAENQTQGMVNVTVDYLNVKYTILLKNLTWFDAQQECLQNNMQLVSIREQYQQAFLAAQAAYHNCPLWIGLSSNDDGIHYHWSDRKHINFSRWSDEDEDLVDDCVYLDSDGFWKTSECYSEKPGAICYLPGNETEKTELYHASVQCPHKIKNTPWITFRNNCYTFMVTKNRLKGLRSDEGFHLCRMMNSNASLLSIRDDEENDFVVDQLRAFSGLARWLWLGLIYEVDGNILKWYDDTRLSYNNWRLGRPDIKSNRFVAGVSLDGFWDIYNNTENWIQLQFSLHSVLVCKIEMGPKEDKPPLPTSLPYKNNTYWILQKQLSWYDAWKECKRKGSELASIHSVSEQVFLEAIVKSDGFPLWIGLSSHNGSDSDFEWSDGSVFDYKPWEVENTLPPGNCFFLDTKGMWNHVECTRYVDGAICYSSSNKIPSKQAESSTKCPKTTSGSSQWIEYKDHCYAFDMAFYNFSAYTADAAKEVCKKLDPSAALLTIMDAEENKFVSTHLKQQNFITGRVWLGMQSNVSNQIGGAIVVAILIIMVLIAGLVYFLYKKKRLQWGGFSSVRYERGIYEEETDSMFTRDGD